MAIYSIDGFTPDVDADAWVAPSADLIGRVKLHAKSSVFYGAVLRGDTDWITIGEGTNLQDNVTIHCDAGKPTTLGKNISVGHLAMLHGCTIEDNCLIGMSATVLNGAVIGEGSLVAAGAVVLENTVIPPRSLVAGVPAKVVRQLDDAGVEGIVKNAEHYLTISAKHRAIAEG